MVDQPNDPKSRAIYLLDHLLKTAESQSAAIMDLSTQINILVNLLTSSLNSEGHLIFQPSQSAAGAVQDFQSDTLIMTYDDKGQLAYKILGRPFSKFGVRTWPETLPALGIDASTLKPGPNPFSAMVRAMMIESATTPGKFIPKKIIGLTPKGG